MTRKSICPVCNKTFEVFLRNQVCCSREHQAEWRKMQRAARDQRRIMPDDLDWCNAQLELRLEQMAKLKADNAILKMEKICAENAETPQNEQNEQKAPEKAQKSAIKSEKTQNSVKNAQKTQIKGKGKYLKECENCMNQFRTNDSRDRFCSDACRMEYAREMGV